MMIMEKLSFLYTLLCLAALVITRPQVVTETTTESPTTEVPRLLRKWQQPSTQIYPPFIFESAGVTAGPNFDIVIEDETFPELAINNQDGSLATDAIEVFPPPASFLKVTEKAATPDLPWVDSEDYYTYFPEVVLPGQTDYYQEPEEESSTTQSSISNFTENADQSTRTGKLKCGTIPNFSDIIDTRNTAALPSEVPWQVRIIVNTETGHQRICGGALIGNNNTVLTAANCFIGVTRLSIIKVVLGAVSRNPSDKEAAYQEVGVKRIYKHRHQSPYSSVFDIALVKIEDVKLSDSIIPACIPTACHKPADLGVCYTSGWKTAWDSSKGGSPILQKAAQWLFKRHSRCGNVTTTRGRVYYEKQQLLCAKVIEPQRYGYCHADMGGPLVCREQHNINKGQFALEGVLSLHTSCIYGSVDVYFRVCQFSNWIENFLFGNLSTLQDDLKEMTVVYL